MSNERDAAFAAKAGQYAQLLDKIEELTGSRQSIEREEAAVHKKRRDLESELSEFVGRNIPRRAVFLGSNTVVVEWQSETSLAAIRLVETVTGHR